MYLRCNKKNPVTHFTRYALQAYNKEDNRSNYKSDAFSSGGKKKDWKTKKDYLIDEVLGCLVFGFESSEKITELNVRTTGNSNTCFSFEGVSFHFLIVSQQSLCFNCWYNISFTVKWDNSERNKS